MDEKRYKHEVFDLILCLHIKSIVSTCGEQKEQKVKRPLYSPHLIVLLWGFNEKNPYNLFSKCLAYK